MPPTFKTVKADWRRFVRAKDQGEQVEGTVILRDVDFAPEPSEVNRSPKRGL